MKTLPKASGYVDVYINSSKQEEDRIVISAMFPLCQQGGTENVTVFDGYTIHSTATMQEMQMQTNFSQWSCSLLYMCRQQKQRV